MYNYKKLLFLVCVFVQSTLFAKKFKKIDPYQPWLKFVPLQIILQKKPEIIYKKCFGEVAFEFKPFQLSSLIPHSGYFKECFILEIPNGRVQDKEGFVIFDGMYPLERVWGGFYDHLRYVVKPQYLNIKKMPGRVAVIAQEGHCNYCHFFNEVLARLAMLEMHNIEYDWLYVTCDCKFIKRALLLWGVDESKIISPTDQRFCIQADTLILPSIVLNTSNGFKHTGVNAHPYTLQYVREKLLSKVKNRVDITQFSKRIFISRRDAIRRILNEDEIFELFKAKGFERYETSKMSVEEQIALFAQAEVVVGEHGAGLTNIMFCQQDTKVIELFQELVDTSFWFPAQTFKLNYTPVKTLDIDVDYFANWKAINPNIYEKVKNAQTNVPLNEVYKVLEIL